MARMSELEPPGEDPPLGTGVEVAAPCAKRQEAPKRQLPGVRASKNRQRGREDDGAGRGGAVDVAWEDEL